MNFLFNNEEEIWKDIPDYEGLYEASSHGRIRSKEGRISIKVRKDGTSYTQRLKSRVLKEKKVTSKNTRRNDKRVDLWKNKRPKTMYVARIIATTFIPNPNNLPEVNHINGDYRDNRVENLEWISKRDNIRHAFDNDLIGTNIKITLKRIDDQKEYSFRSMSKASEFIGRNHGYVSLRLKKDYETAIDVDGNEYKIIITD